MKNFSKILFSFFLFNACSSHATQKAVVIVPVADLRSDRSLAPLGQSDDKQQTQLLSGETVEVVAKEGDWVQVNAVEQLEFTTHQKWEGYPGWVLRKSLRFGKSKNVLESFPSVLKPANANADRRANILETSKKLIGTPYVWGGLSPKDPSGQTRLTGLDCSGLVHLAYRVNGMMVPRDSMDQYLLASKIQRKDLKPGDLIFSSTTNKPEKITHVTIYAGNGQIVEAPQTGMVVREISFKEKYGIDFSSVESGQTAGDRVIYFGRFIKD
jgi:gamma-D-glutamyl-L-lysine dipeptidyl-peptidase